MKRLKVASHRPVAPSLLDDVSEEPFYFLGRARMWARLLLDLPLGLRLLGSRTVMSRPPVLPYDFVLRLQPGEPHWTLRRFWRIPLHRAVRSRSTSDQAARPWAEAETAWWYIRAFFGALPGSHKARAAPIGQELPETGAREMPTGLALCSRSRGCDAILYGIVSTL